MSVARVPALGAARRICLSERSVSSSNLPPQLHICRILESPTWHLCPPQIGEWTATTGGGKLGLPPGPGSEWRKNTQYTLRVSTRCTVVIALAQPDALLDANDAVDGYQIPIGFTILSADP